MRFYKEKEVEVKRVRQYDITKVKCDHCGELITGDDNEYCKIVEYPVRIELDAEIIDVHKKCLCDYLTNGLDIDVYNEIRIEYDKFEPYTVEPMDINTDYDCEDSE